MGARPLGWDLVIANGWSHLGLFSVGETWFRGESVYKFFDNLVDQYFFETFDQVLFFGAGPAGYAACVYSVAAPDARVLALNPQATLTPDVIKWDGRFPQANDFDLIGRYGYAPDMVDAARDVTIIYDSSSEQDAQHAGMFSGSNITHFCVKVFGLELRRLFIETNGLKSLLDHISDGTLTSKIFVGLYRGRHENKRYLRRLFSSLLNQNRPYLAAMLCRHVLARGRASFFAGTWIC